MTEPNVMTHTAGVVPVVGFVVKKFIGIPPSPKDEDDMGRIQVVLEASKEELRATDKDINDIVGALNSHQSTKEIVAVQLRF